MGCGLFNIDTAPLLEVNACMRPLLLAACLWFCTGAIFLHAAGDIEFAKPAVHCELDLSDGSHLIGAPNLETLKLSTSYSHFEIPLTLLQNIDFGSQADDPAQVHFQNGDLISAHLEAKEIELKAIFGKVIIPIAQIRRIQFIVSQATRADGLVLHYSFNDAKDGKVADDSGSGNNGSVQGTIDVVEGQLGNAIRFDGQRTTVTLGNKENLHLQNFTIVMWIKRGNADRISPNGDCVLFGYGEGGYAVGLREENQLFLTKVGVDNVTSDLKINDTDYHLIAVTKEGSKVIFYLDGKPSEPLDYNATFEFNTTPGIGARPDTLSNGFIGSVDDLSVFSRILTPKEIKSIYDAQKPATPPPAQTPAPKKRTYIID